MSSTEAHAAGRDTSTGNVDMKLEVQIIPVSDVDRSKEFYERLGFRLDGDAAPMEGLRIVQFTPTGSETSVTFGLGLTTAAPGSAEGGLIVSDIEAARDELVSRRIEVSDIWHGPPFPVEARQPGPDRSAHDDNWPAWYAAYMAAEQAGTDLPSQPIPRSLRPPRMR